MSEGVGNVGKGWTYVSETSDGGDDVGALVHDDDGTGTETGLRVLEGVVVHTVEREHTVVVKCKSRTGLRRTA